MPKTSSKGTPQDVFLTVPKITLNGNKPRINNIISIYKDIDGENPKEAVLKSFTTVLLALCFGAVAFAQGNWIEPHALKPPQRLQKSKSHKIMTNILTKSFEGKLLAALLAIYNGLSAKIYAYLPDDDAITESIKEDLQMLLENKGFNKASKLNNRINNKEDRQTWLRGEANYIRGTWATAPVFNPSLLGLKDPARTKPQIKNFILKQLAATCSLDIPESTSIFEKSVLSFEPYVNLELYINDSLYDLLLRYRRSILKACSLDQMLSIKRTAGETPPPVYSPNSNWTKSL